MRLAVLFAVLLVVPRVFAGPAEKKAADSDDDSWQEDAHELDKRVKSIKDDKATAANPTMPPPEREEAKRDLPQRYDDIENIADRHKENPVAQEKVTEAYLDVEEPKRAAPHADQFVDLARKKDDAETLGRALDLRAGVKLNLRDYKGAATDAREALSKKPGDDTARRLLALAQSKGVGDVNLSKIKKPENLEAGAPGRSAAASAGGPAGAGTPGRGAQVLSDARQTAELRAQAAAHDDAQRYLSLGDFPAAIKSINVSLAKHPKSAPLLVLRSQAELGAGRPAEAMADAQAAVLAGPKVPEAYVARAKAGEAVNAPAAQIAADYETAKELDPRFTADYERTLARLGAGSANPNVDANGIGTMGRKGLGFNPATARRELFGGLPEPLRSLAPVLIIALVAAIVAGATWLFSRYGGRS